LTRDRTSAGIVAVEPNSLAAIDPETNRVVAEIPVGARPASVVFANGALWVANLDDNSVSRIDTKTRRVVRTIATGTAPSDLAGAGGAVWAIGGERGVVLRIDPAFNEVVGRIKTVKFGTVLTAASATGAIAATRNAVWAVSGGFFSTPRLFQQRQLRTSTRAERTTACRGRRSAEPVASDRVGLSGRTSGRERREIRVRHGLLQQPGRRHDRLLRTNPPHLHALGHRHAPPLAPRAMNRARA